MAGEPRDHWYCVSRLGKLDASDEELASAVALVAALDPDEVYAAVLASRVYTIAQRNLERTPRNRTADAVLASLCELAESEALRRARAAPETRAVLEHAGSGAARVIKGLPLRERYAQPHLRHEGDIDLQAPDWAAGLRVASWLRQRGWQWDTTEFPWIKWDDHGHLYGQLTLVLPDNDAPYARVDLHIGPFSVGHAGVMPLVGWERATVLGIAVEVPNRETTVALIAAHALNDGILSMKDVNDLHVVLSDHAPTDWASVEELCRHVHATDVLRQLLAVTGRVYPEHGLPSTHGPAALGHRETPAGRARRVARLAFRDERSRGAGLVAAARSAREAERYFAADLTPRLASPALPAPPLPRRRSACWRLLPEQTWRSLSADGVRPRGVTEDVLGADLVLLRGPRGTAVRAGTEVFVPTIWGGVHPESVALARQAATAS